MPTTARDVMQTGIVTLGPNTPLDTVQRLFVEEEIHGAPVVSDAGDLLGVLSSQDLLRAMYEERDTAQVVESYLRDDLEFSGPDWNDVPQDFHDRLAQRTASDAMTPQVVTVAPDMDVSEVAGVLRRNRIHRVLVVDESGLLGILTSFDLLACLEKAST